MDVAGFNCVYIAQDGHNLMTSKHGNESSSLILSDIWTSGNLVILLRRTRWHPDSEVNHLKSEINPHYTLKLSRLLKNTPVKNVT
jgi:hypothetical protein